MDNGKKNALKIFTTNDIRKHAREWTLAGDVGLLAHLEQFSESVINKTQETQTNFNELVDDYEELYTKVGNITNQFLALQNCQFVENRVYDEETPTEEKPEVKEQNEADQEKLLVTQYKEAVEVGIKLLDTHFQEYQLPPNSDSDEEDEVLPGNSIIWKPKNPYASKKFPFLIGSSEWWADDSVGLRPNKEGLDTEKIISESESDIESLKSVEKTMKSSSSPSPSSSSSMENIKSIPVKPVFMESTEDLFGFDRNEISKNNDELSKGSNSLADETANFLPDLDPEAETEVKKRGDSSVAKKPPEERPSEAEIIPSKPKKVDNEFTRELMAKLVSVTNKTENGVQVQKGAGKMEEAPRPAPPPQTKGRQEESLFDDETDDGSDLFSSTITRVKEKDVEGRKGLFFDAENDDELFKGENDLFSGNSLFESEVFKESQQPARKNNSEGRGGDSTVKPTERKEGSPPKRNLVNDLFNDLDDDEDTLFAAKPVKQNPSEKSLASMEKQKEKNKETKVAAGPVLDWENDEGLFEIINSTTAVDDDLFSSAGLFDTKVNNFDSKAEETKSDIPSKEPQTVINPENKAEEMSKKSSVLSSNTTKQTLDDPFGFSSSKDTAFKKISVLDSDEEDDLFSKSFPEEKKVKAMPAANDGDAEDDDDTALFTDKSKPLDSVSVSSSRSSLFDDVSASKSRLASVFERDKAGKGEESLANVGGEARGARDLFSGKAREEKISLFDDCDDDDLFGAGTKPITAQQPLFERSSVETVRTEKKESLVDDLEENDLFKTSGAPTKLRTTKSDILRHSEEKLFANEPFDADLFSEKSATAKPKPPSSLSLKPTETGTKGQTVGKLNIPDNLKVKFESVAKKISPGGMKPLTAVEKIQEETKEEVLDEPLQTSTLLKCPSKDRVKIPGRRRPQSRRARQEAIRNSGNWDQLLTSSSTLLLGRESSPVMSNPLSPSTDEEDFFKVPELDTNFEKEDQSIFKSDLFESSKASKLDDNLLFDGAPVLSPLGARKAEQSVEEPTEKPATTPETEKLFGSGKRKVVSIFDDDEEDDLNGEDDESLFKSSKPSHDSTTSQKTEKKPLFDPEMDDDDDEDDLFGGKSHAPPSKPPPVINRKEGGEPKEKGNSSFVDPLGLMTKDE